MGDGPQCRAPPTRPPTHAWSTVPPGLVRDDGWDVQQLLPRSLVHGVQGSGIACVCATMTNRGWGVGLGGGRAGAGCRAGPCMVGDDASVFCMPRHSCRCRSKFRGAQHSDRGAEPSPLVSPGPEPVHDFRQHAIAKTPGFLLSTKARRKGVLSLRICALAGTTLLAKVPSRELPGRGRHIRRRGRDRGGMSRYHVRESERAAAQDHSAATSRLPPPRRRGTVQTLLRPAYSIRAPSSVSLRPPPTGKPFLGPTGAQAPLVAWRW